MLRRSPRSRRCSRIQVPGAPGGASGTGEPHGSIHIEESCLGSHQASPPAALATHTSGAGGRMGVQVERKRPEWHGIDLSESYGQAARQNLESCVSCHSERDCLGCHSAVGGRRFDPHGPGFDPETLRRKNPSMCTACHGASIPGG